MKANSTDLNLTSLGIKLYLTLSRNSFEDTARMIAQHGQDLKFDDLGLLLVLSAQRGSARICAMLIELGAAVDYRVDKYTPLFAAVMNEHIDVVQYLQSQGASPNQALHTGVTPLMFAAHRADEEMVLTLLQGGADTEARGLHQSTALYCAIEAASLPVVKVLLDFGADPGAILEPSKITLYQLAEAKKLPEISVALLNPCVSQTRSNK